MIITQIFGLLGIFTFGFLISGIFLGSKSQILERISVGFLLGSGLFTFILFLTNWWLRVPFKTVYSLLILLLLNVFAFAVNVLVRKIRKEKKLFDYNFNFKKAFENLSGGEIVIMGIILILFLSSLIYNIYWPVAAWDALALYDFRAKSFIATSFMQDAISRGYFTTYPLYTSLLHAFLYLINFRNPAFFYTILYVSLVLLFYFVMLRISSNRLLSLTLALFVSINSLIYIHSEMSYTNLPYAVFIGVGFAYLICSFCKDEINTKLFFLGVLLISLGNWVRVLEPFWVLSIPFIVLLLVYTKKVVRFLGALLILYLPRFLWLKFLTDYKVIQSSVDTKSLLSVKGMVLNFFFLNHVKIIYYFYKNMLSPYNTLLIAFLISFGLLMYLVFIVKTIKFNLKDNQSVFLFTPSILVFFSVVIMLLGLYLFTLSYGDMAYGIADSATRSTMPFLLILLFSIFLNLSYILNFLTRRKKFD